MNWTNHSKFRLKERFGIKDWEAAMPILDRAYGCGDYVTTRECDNRGVKKVWLPHLQIGLSVDVKLAKVLTVYSKPFRWDPSIQVHSSK